MSKKMTEDLQLIVTTDDVRRRGGDRLVDELMGSRRAAMLGKDEENLVQSFMKLMPAIVADKISDMLPKNYEVVELTLNFKLSGSIGIVGVNGDVQLKLRPLSTPRQAP
jgi:hypothetical protein